MYVCKCTNMYININIRICLVSTIFYDKQIILCFLRNLHLGLTFDNALSFEVDCETEICKKKQKIETTVRKKCKIYIFLI